MINEKKSAIYTLDAADLWRSIAVDHDVYRVENDVDGDKFRLIKLYSSSCISKGTTTNLEAYRNENSAKSDKSEEIFSTSSRHWDSSEVTIIEAKQEY